MMRWIELGVFIAWLAIVPAQAQQSSGFTFNAATSLSVTGTSSNVAYPGSGSKLIVQNTGSNTAYLLQGNFSGTTATTASFPLTAGACIYLQATPGGYIAGITASSTTTVLVTQGEGDPPIYCGGSSGGGGGGGSVTQGTSPWVDNITQWATVTLGAPTAWGTAPSGNVPGFNGNILASVLPTGAASATNQTSQITQETATATALGVPNSTASCTASSTTTVLQCLFQMDADIRGPIPALNATAYNTNSYTTGSTSAANADLNGNLYVNLGRNNGTAGTPSTSVLSVQGVASMTPFQVALNTTPTIANGNGVVPTQGGSVLSATNGAYTNLLQGNAVLSATNPSFASVTDGTNKAAVKAANTAPTTSDPGLVANVNCSYTGSPCITLGGATPANSVPTVGAGFTYGNMTTATTTTFKSGAGVLHTITIGTLGTVASTISIFDNTAGSGTSIGVLNSLTTGEGTYTFDVAFATGLTLVTTGTVAPNVTVSYR